MDRIGYALGGVLVVGFMAGLAVMSAAFHVSLVTLAH